MTLLETRPGLLFYCQHSVGLGHLVRSLNLADGLAERFRVTLLNGGPWPRDLVAPAGVDVVHLPPLGHDDDYQLISRDPRHTVDEAVALRTAMVLDAFATTHPEVVLVELFPFGRKKFRFELVPLLEAAGSRADPPLVACSVRDILVGSRRDQQGHDDRAAGLADAYFDVVLVHADQRFATLGETFHPTAPMRTPVHYTGFVRAAQAPRPPRPREARVLVSAGGGLVGEPLFRAAVGARQRLLSEHALRTTLVTGPFLPEPVVDDLTRLAAVTEGLDVVRFLPDLAGEMAASAVSVSQVGYNTTMDILGSGTPAVVVPYGVGREDEQAERARRLERLGALRVVDADRLSGDTLADAVAAALDRPPLPVPLDLDGRTRTALLLHSLRRQPARRS
jgi:predicted glycosyltransferase